MWNEACAPKRRACCWYRHCPLFISMEMVTQSGRDAEDVPGDINCVFLEYNCILSTPLPLILELLNSTKKPVVWPGFTKHQCWNNTQGCKMVAFRGNGLQLAHTAAHRTVKCYHLDGVLSRRIKLNSIFVPKKSFAGFRSHDSVSESTGRKLKITRRSGYKPPSRTRDDIVERHVSKWSKVTKKKKMLKRKRNRC